MKSLSWAILASLLAAQGVAGCMGQGDSNQSTSLHGRRPLQVVVATPALNLTGCVGTILSIPVPINLVADDLPPAYRPFQNLPGAPSIWIETRTCEKIAAHGKDGGPGSITFVAIDVQPPATAPPPQGFASLYLVEVLTSLSAAAEVFASIMISARPASTVTEVTPMPIAYDVVHLRVDANAATWYDSQFYNSKGNKESPFSLRFFYGPNPKTDFFDQVGVETRSSSSGVGEIRLAGESRVSQVMNGALAAGVLGGRALASSSLVLLNETASAG